MITPLHSPATAKALFAAHELPDEVQAPVLRELVVPRVISFSMVPTLEADDRLELEPADNLQIGDLVVFRQETAMICHRIVRMEEGRLSTQGDAVTLSEEINASQVVGRVTGIVRNGLRMAVPPLSAGARRTRRYGRSIAWCRDTLYILANWWFERLVSIPFFGERLRQRVLRLVAVDIMEQAPLHSMTGYIKRHTYPIAHIQNVCDTCETVIDRTTLIVRIGPVLLATCRLAPWSVQQRAFAATLGIDTSIHGLREVVRRHRLS